MNKQNLIWGLEELSDRDMQERIWLGNSPGEMSSFVEAICSTFDDSGLGAALDSNRDKVEISPELREKALQLDRLIKSVPQTLAEIEIINHPVMQEIRIIAGEMLLHLNKE